MSPPSHDRAGSSAGEDRSLSLIALLNILLRNRWLVIGLPIIVAVLLLLVNVVRGREYVATARFSPQQGTGSSAALAGFASQFGIDVGANGGGQSLEYYVALLSSGDLLRQAVTTPYRFQTEEGRAVEADLLTLYEIEEEGGEGLAEAVEQLKDRIHARADLKSNVISMRVTADHPELAEALSARILEILNEFNLAKKREQAAAEREFIETRLADYRGNLEAAESRLQEFRMQNRSIAGSPQLQFEEARLRRELQLLEQVYISLAQSAEQARIDEVRNVPLITIIDSPAGSSEPASSRAALVVMGMGLGLVIAMILIFGRHYFALQREVDPEEYSEYRELRTRLLGDLSPRRFVGRRSNG